MWPEHVPVLIAGGGTVGLSAALFLAHHRVDALVVERQAGPSPHPRATGVGPRTVEFFREVGIEAEVDAAAVDVAGGGGKVSGETLATADLSAAAAASAASERRSRVGPNEGRAVSSADSHGCRSSVLRWDRAMAVRSRRQSPEGSGCSPTQTASTMSSTSSSRLRT